MSSGIAVLAICSPNSDMAKMIIENDMGYVIENGDTEAAVNVIKSIKNDPAVLIKKGDNAFNYLNSNFTLRSAAEMYYNLIKKYQ